jgi:hypothetical protein
MIMLMLDGAVNTNNFAAYKRYERRLFNYVNDNAFKGDQA